MSNFDPMSFLAATTTEALVKRPPIPPGVYIATIGEIKAQEFQGKKDPTAVYLAIDLPLEISPDMNPGVTGLEEKVTVRDRIMLDRNESGMIDWGKGKNGKLRMYREALGMNVAGEPFNIMMMQHRQVKVNMQHRAGEGDQAGQVFEQPSGVVKM